MRWNRSLAHRLSWRACALCVAVAPALILSSSGVGASAAVRSTAEVAPPPRTYAEPTRVLSFAGDSGTPPDPAVWNHDVGANWGNGELQIYTTSTANCAQDGSGNLVVTARREETTSADGIRRQYTSARINTQNKVEVPSGSYVEASILAPTGTGVWPAFWLLGTDIGTVGWPASGELDVMEVLGSEPTIVRNAAHQSLLSDPQVDLPYGWHEPGGSVDLGQPVDNSHHQYGVYFDRATVRFYVDRVQRRVLTADDALASGRSWPYANPQFIVLNIAVGGWEDPSSTTFPRSMSIEHISIWAGGVPF